MALSDFVLQKETVAYRGGSFEVHGINFDVVNRIILDGHRAEVDRAIQMLQDSLNPETGEIGDLDLTTAFASIMREFPVLIAKIVAACADDIDNWANVYNMPVSVQLDAVVKVSNLTFDGEDSIKKFLENLILMVMQIRNSGAPAMKGVAAGIRGGKR